MLHTSLMLCNRLPLIPGLRLCIKAAPQLPIRLSFSALVEQQAGCLLLIRDACLGKVQTVSGSLDWQACFRMQEEGNYKKMHLCAGTCI